MFLSSLVVCSYLFFFKTTLQQICLGQVMVKSSLQYKIQVLLFIFSLSFLLRDKNVVLALLLSLADESLVEQLQTGHFILEQNVVWVAFRTNSFNL